ncbi:EamA family transporter RarD [Paracoccus sp. S-4012]|nr:EamA family transporter RarD [Paracoccus sp. S-4012]
MIGACVIWGSSPLYFSMLVHVPTGEVMAHRVIWSLVLFLGVLAVQGRLRALPAAFARPGSRLRLTAAAFAVGSNWLLFLIAIATGQVIQSSLGYYIFPLIAVLIGTLFFGERLRALQVAAVALAALAVLILTLGLGVTPWFSLAIAGTFAVYSALKKGLDLPPMVSVTAEFAVLAPFAILWLVAVPSATPAFGSDAATTALLLGSSLVTAVPMMLFTSAARRVDLATVGVLQYLNPTLQFLGATLILREPFTGWHVLAFSLIWTAVALYCAATLVRRRALPGARARL